MESNVKKFQQLYVLTWYRHIYQSFCFFEVNNVRIESFDEILVDCRHNWLIIGLHLPVTPAVCYGLVKIAASNYWMFLYPIVGCIQPLDYIQLLEFGLDWLHWQQRNTTKQATNTKKHDGNLPGWQVVIYYPSKP